MKLKGILSALLLLTATTSAHADFWSKNFTNPAKKGIDAVTKPLDKAVEWAGKQSGITPTVDNANQAANAAEAAANEAKVTAAQVQQTLAELTPLAKETALSVKKTSDGLTELVQLLKWPLFALFVMGALWMAAKALAAWKLSPAAAVLVLAVGAALWFGGKLAAEGKLHLPVTQPAIAAQN